MPSIDVWQYIIVVCTAVGAMLTVGGMLWKGARRMFGLSRQVLRQASEFFRQVNGDDEHPPMMDVMNQTLAVSQDNAARLARVEKGLAEHLDQGHPVNHMTITSRQRRRK